MELTENTFALESFLTITLAIIVLFIGKSLNARFKILRDLNLPEPVVGGLLFATIFALIYYGFGITVSFDLAARDAMLVYFFTTIGLSSNVRDIAKGGKPLLIFLVAVLLYMILQNVIGVSVAVLFDVDPILGLLGGTVSLVGGHGTAIAWAPTFAKEYGITNALEIGIAAATFGLILASLVGGPAASYLIKKHKLETKEEKDNNIQVGIRHKQEDMKIDYLSFLHAIVAIHISIIIGYVVNGALIEMGVKLPLFVTALFAGILISSFITSSFSKKSSWINWSARSLSMSLIADISLGIFLAMSLMSMQIWVLADLAGPIIVVLAIQFIATVLIAIFIIFKIMGSGYDAAVIAAGFIGISLGSTATAMANMTAVTQKYGASILAFLVVPLVCAVFVDIFNVVLIQTILSYF